MLERDGQVLGFWSLLVPGRGQAGDGELDLLFVADHEQGKGLGRTLVEDLLRHAAKAGLARVHVVSHPPAEPFYRAAGAVPAGEVRARGSVTWSRPLLVFDVQGRPAS